MVLVMSHEVIAEPAGVPCSNVLKALADENRFAVVRLLLDKPRLFMELQEALEVEQSLLSHHLRLLRELGIVTSERNGKSVLYSLTPGIEFQQDGQSLNFGCCRLSFPSNPQGG